MGSMTRLDQRLVWIEDLLGSKTITSCCGSRKLLFCRVREFVCCCSFFELLWFTQDLVLCRVMGLYTNLHVEMATSTRRLSIISWYSFPFLRKPTHLMCNSKTITSIPKQTIQMQPFDHRLQLVDCCSKNNNDNYKNMLQELVSKLEIIRRDAV